MSVRGSLGLALGALSMLAVLAACQPNGERAGPANGPAIPVDDPAGHEDTTAAGTFRWGIQEPDAIVPPHATDQDGLAVVDAVFDSLTRWDDELEPAPAAATDWSSEDQLVWTFALREGAMFHDDPPTPVTAGDFKFAWERAVAEDGAGYHLRLVEGYAELRAGETDALAGVEAVDDHTLQVTLRAPHADFPAVVGHPALGPVHRTAWEADPDGYAEQPVGNGPFRVAEAWARGQFIRLARFDDWQNGPVAELGEVVFQIMDRDTAYLAFQQGRLDFTELPSGALDNAIDTYGRSADGYSGPGVLTGEIPVVYYLGFDVTAPPFDDPDVRQALSLAVDRTAIARDNLEGNLTVARSLVSPAIPGSQRVTCASCRLDRTRAEEILSDRGITELRLWFNRGGGHERIAQQVRADLREVGVRLAFQTEEFADYLDVLRAGEAEVFRFGWTAEYPTLDDSLRPILHSSAIPGRGSESAYNYGRYADEGVDDLLDEGRMAADPGERTGLYREAERLAVGRDQAVIPLVVYRHRAVVSDRFEDFRLDPMGRVELYRLSFSEDS